MATKSSSRRSSSKRRQSEPPKILSPGVVVAADFQKKCRDAIRKALGDNIAVVLVPSTRGALTFFKGTTAPSLAPDKIAGELPVTRLCGIPGTMDSVWIALGYLTQIPPVKRQASTVNHLTIRLYIGGLDAASKRLVARGEWDLVETEAAQKKGHAQPHWHFHLIARPEIPESVRDLTDEMKKASPESISNLLASLSSKPAPTTKPPNGASEGKAATQKIHFPMAAVWKTLPLSCMVRNADESGICRWFEGMTAYLKTQFTFLYE